MRKNEDNEAEIIVSSQTGLKSVNKAVGEVVDDHLFLPSPFQQNLKAQFWSRAGNHPFLEPENIGVAFVRKFVKDARLERYWKEPGFKEWFTNQDENRERLEYLWSAGLDAAEAILRDPAQPAAAKVNLIKILAEMQGHVSRGKNGQEKFSDEAVNKMSEKELKEWLQKKGVTVKASYEVTPNDSKG
jgi:hypothetical protein